MDALKAFSKRDPLSLALSSQDWAHIPHQIRLRALFSAHVQSIRFLTAVHASIASTLARWAAAESTQDFATERAHFVNELNRVAMQEGMGPLSPLAGGELEDISSATRLKLIFDTLTRSAYGYASYAWQVRHAADYPAARFVRHPGAKTKRPLHEQNENVIRLFTDIEWWVYMNSRSLGGFEVPWPPYGYNSWMDREPISRQVAISIGLIHEGYSPTVVDHPGFNDRLSVDVSQVPSPIFRKLRRAFKGTTTYSRKVKRLIFHPKK